MSQNPSRDPLASVNQQFDNFFPVHGKPLPKPAPKKAIPKHYLAHVHGVPFAYTGDHDKGDKSTGWPEGFTVEKVWIDSDPEMHDLADLLPQSIIQQLESFGCESVHQEHVDAKADAAEARHEAERDEALSNKE